MSRFEPVHLPEDRRLNGRASQTFLKHYARCPRSGYLYALYRGEAMTREMQRGRAFHIVAERATRAMVEQDEVMIPAEVVKDIVNEVLAEVPVPFEEHDLIREMSYRWAAETAVDPRAVVACETLFTLDVAGFAVRAKVDYAALLEEGAVCSVRDWKTSRAAPPFDDVARKRPDGTLLARNFQLVLYALALAFGVPVREEDCGACSGKGYTVELGPDWASARLPCRECGGFNPFLDVRPRDRTPEMQERMGRGVVEVPEPFPLASRAQRFDLEFVYPGIEDRDGKMLRRPMSLTRAELDEYRGSLDGLLRRLAESERTGDWPAVASDEACGECPAKALCPIPVELRDFRGSINTVEEAAEAFERASVERRIAAATAKERRAFVKAHGPVRFGGGMVAEIGHTSSERIPDKDAFLAAVERTAQYGEPLERERYVKTVESFPLVERALTADELAESEGSDGRDNGSGDGLDERFGKDAPY